jgi:integrating conjugative element protein (TIGR03757 family)
VYQTRIYFITLSLMICKAAVVYADTRPIPESIIVITSQQRPVTGKRLPVTGPQPEVEIYYLDAVKNIEDQLSNSLPPDVGQAKQLVTTRIAQQGQTAFEHQLQEAYQPLLLMMRYQLDRYPVMIFDERAVIYGITDIPQAMQRYQVWAASKRESDNE